MQIHIPDFDYTIYDDETDTETDYTVTVNDCFIAKPNLGADNPDDYYGYVDVDWTLLDHTGKPVSFTVSDHDKERIEIQIHETAHSILYEH